MSAYPPPQEGYPPEKSGYPPEPAAPYPTQQGGYPTQAPYPSQPQPQGYSPQQQAGGAPPPYYDQQQTAYPIQGQPPPVQQQTHTNVVMVNQPVAPRTVYQPRNSEAGTAAMVFAIVITFFGLFSGCIWVLVCSIPAIVIALNASSAGSRGDLDSARTNERISIGCSVFAILFGVVGVIAIVGGIVGWYVTLLRSF